MGSKTTSKVTLVLECLPDDKCNEISINQKLYNELTVHYNPKTMNMLPIDLIAISVENFVRKQI